MSANNNTNNNQTAKKSKRVHITANSVNVSSPNMNVSGNGNSTATGKAARRRRNRQRRRAAGKSTVQEQALEGGALTDARDHTVTRLGGRLNVSSMPLDLDPNAVSWYFKYVDPAGATESGRALGEYSKIPDGLVKFSVDAEIRTIFNEQCPRSESREGDVPLDGKNWSISFISLPCFRTNYIAVCDVLDGDIGFEEMALVYDQINSLVNWRNVVDSGDWIHVEGTSLYWKIRVNNPIYDLPDPTEGALRTVTDYRLTYKSLTIESNVPTLIDQGYWIGGHYAITPTPTSLSADGGAKSEGLSIGNMVFATSNGTIELNIPGLTYDGFKSSYYEYVPTVLLTHDQFVFTLTVPANTLHQGVWSEGRVRLPSDGVIRRGSDVWATDQDIITVRVQIVYDDGSNARRLTILSSHDGAEAFSQTRVANTSAKVELDMFQHDFTSFSAINEYRFEPPPTALNQIAANNPKIEQFLTKESGGAYTVHSKMRNPVFELTPAGSFGFIKFSAPGFPGRPVYGGIRDTIDRNFSTSVVSFRGISQAQTLVVKTYLGWEGITSQNTPFGQFAHSGLLRCPEVLQMAENLAADLTGIYPANDNFAAMVAGFAANALSGLMKGESTTSVITGIANQALGAAGISAPKLVGGLVNKLGAVGGRLVGRLRQRRAARRNRRS